MEENGKFICDQLEDFAFSSTDQKMKSQNKKQKPQILNEIQSQSAQIQEQDPVLPQNISRGKVPVKKGSKKQQGLSIIQEQQFKYIWNVLREKQDSQYVNIRDIQKATANYLKSQHPEDVLLVTLQTYIQIIHQEMLNVMNPQLYADDLQQLEYQIDYEHLKQIFLACKLKI